MAVTEFLPGIFSVGVRDWDRRLFDELIPLPDGTSYNSYLIKGEEKTALIDTVDPSKIKEFMENMDATNSTGIDYIICNHAEQDHSGLIPMVLEKHPKAKVICSPKCKGFLIDLLHIEDDAIITVEDNETLSLGGKTLEFIFTPWVHWPETMATYLKEENILFSCDFFGSHLASSDLFVTDEAKVIKDAKRYYAEIMMPFRTIIRKNIEKISRYQIKIIAPSHGPIYNKPQIIIDAYRGWVSDDVSNTVLIPYVSMHGSTAKIVEHLVDKLMAKGLIVKPFNLVSTDLGELAMALVDAATIILATPTVLSGPHPAVIYAASLVSALKPKARFAGIVGSYGWGGRSVENLLQILSNLKLELLDPVLIKGHPKESDYNTLDQLAEGIFSNHKKLNLT